MSANNFLFSSDTRRDLLTNVTTVAMPATAPALVSRFDYILDGLGRRVQRVDTSAGVTTNEFGYNPRSELISALMPVLSGVEGGANAFGWVY